ncbi:MAG: SHOCT domain-containing protein [bacterium]
MRYFLIPMALAITLLSCVYRPGGHMMDWGYGIGGFAWPLIILVVLVGVAIYFIKNREKLKQDNGEDSALEILKTRYAKGEITKQQYEEMKKDLNE